MIRYRSFVLFVVTTTVLASMAGCGTTPANDTDPPPGPPCDGVVCDDGNSCTSDSCLTRTGACTHTQKVCGGNSVCDPDSGDCVAPEISFDGTTVRASEAVIVSEGIEFDDEATISADGLIGVLKDDEVYLYHPSLGDATLSEYNSRRAIGLLVARSSERIAASQQKRGPYAKLAIGETRSLATGATVERNSSTTYLVRNQKVRWLAVKSEHVPSPVGGFAATRDFTGYPAFRF